MKIRTDYVTNSSSSSFITIVATKKDGSVIVDKLECDGNADDHIYFSECIDELVNPETKNGSAILDNLQKMYNNPRMDYLLDQSGEKHLLRNITDLKLLKKIEFSEEIFGDILDCITCIDEEGDFVCPASSQITISYDVEKEEYSEPFITAKNSDGDALEIYDESELYDEDEEDEEDEDDWDEDEKKYLPLNMLNTVRMPNFMKIALTVAVQDKKGKTYSFEETLSEYDDDRDIWCSFNYDLNSLLVKSIIRKFKDNVENEYELCNFSPEMNSKIENMSVGDPVTFVKIPYNLGTYETFYKIGVKHKEGSLGLVYGGVFDVATDAFCCDAIKVNAFVSSVTPLSKRRKNAKRALISISVDVEEKDKNRIMVCDSVNELTKILMNSVSYYTSLDMESEYVFKENWAAKKRDFIKEVTTQLGSVNDIARISVCCKYRARGPLADAIPYNDKILCDLAEKVCDSTGIAQREALKEMRKYIEKPSSDRKGETFARDYDDIRYKWSGDDN